MPVRGIKPGTLRLQTQNLIVLQAVTETFEPAALTELVDLTNGLIRAGQRDRATVASAAKALLDWVERDAHPPPVLRCRRDVHAQDAGQVWCDDKAGDAARSRSYSAWRA